MMKPFFTSFLVVSIAAATAWQVGRTRPPHPAGAPVGTRVAPEEIPAAPSPGETLARWFPDGHPDPSSRLPGAREFAALDSLPTESIAHWMRSRPPRPHDHLWTALAVEWATRDGPAALAFAIDLRARHPRTGNCACCGGDPGGQFHVLVDEVHAAWIAADPAAALAHDVPPPPAGPEGASPAPQAANQTLAFHDLGKCLDLLAGEPPFYRGNLPSLVHMMDSPNRESGLSQLIARQLVVPEKRAEFAAWLGSRPEPHAALGVFARVWEATDQEPGWLHPDHIPAWMPLRGQMPADFSDPKMLRFMGALAVGAHPLEMMDAPANMADEPCAHAWAYRDPDSAAAWAAGQTPDAALDFALVGLAKGLAITDPAAATAWAARIHRQGTRLREIARHYPRWQREDPAAARAWLDSSPFPADERLAIRSWVTE